MLDDKFLMYAIINILFYSVHDLQFYYLLFIIYFIIDYEHYFIFVFVRLLNCWIYEAVSIMCSEVAVNNS